MGRAALHQVQLNGTHLTADFLLDQALQIFSHTAQIGMPKNIHRTAFRLAAHVISISVANPFADHCHNIGGTTVCILNLP